MTVSLLDNFSYNGKKPNLSRDLMPSIEAMRNYNENYLPPVFTALCEEDSKRYRLNTLKQQTDLAKHKNRRKISDFYWYYYKLGVV